MSDSPEPSLTPSETERIAPAFAEDLFAIARAPAKPDPLPTPEELQRSFPQYEILAVLGRGGMGVVYKGKHKGLDRNVAIKLLPPELGENPDFAARFQREARAMARLDHPNIIAVHDYGQTADGRLYLVMEFVDGANLHALIHSGALANSAQPVAASASPSAAVPGALAPLAIAAQLCDALAYAHEEGIVHRDIKPANVMIDRRDRVKVADFGLARILATEIDASALTTTGTVMGTFDYMAPEQRKGMQVDARADIYSLGVMIYEMFCGEVPHGAFAPPSAKVQCDPRIDSIVLRAMQSEPAQRYQSTAEMKVAVDDLRASPLAPSPARSGAAVRASPISSASRRNIFIAVALLVAGSGAWWIFFGRDAAPRVPSTRSLSGATMPSYPVGQWTKMVISPEELSAGKASINSAGELTVHGFKLPGTSLRNVAIRGEMRQSPDHPIAIFLRSTPAGKRQLVIQPNETRVQLVLPDGSYPTLSKLEYPAGTAKVGDWIPFHFGCVGETSVGAVRGASIPPARSSQLTEAGSISLAGTAEFRNLELLNLDGLPEAEALKLAQAGAIAPPPNASTPAPIKLWDAPEKLPQQNGVRWTDGALRLDRGSLNYDERPSRDALIRARIKMNVDARDPQLFLRKRRDVSQGIATYVRAVLLAQQNQLWLELATRSSKDADDRIHLGTWPLPRSYAAEEWALLELRAEGDSLTVALDGQELGSVRDHTLNEAGAPGIYASENGYFRDIEYVPLDRPSTGFAADKRWHDVLQDREKLALSGAVERTREGLRFTGSGWAMLDHSGPPHCDGAVRLRATFEGIEGPRVSLYARWDIAAGSYALYVLDSKTVVLNRFDAATKTNTILRQFPLRQALQKGQSYELEFHAVDQTFGATINGEALGSIEDATFHTGQFGINVYAVKATDTAPALVKSFEMLDLSVAIPPETAAIKLWDIAAKITFGGARWEDNALRLDGGAPVDPSQVHRDGILRARIKMNPDADVPQLILRERPNGNTSSFYRLVVIAGQDKQRVRLEVTENAKDPSETKLLGEWPLPRQFAPDEWALLELRVEGDTLTAKLDGQVLGTVHDSTLMQPGAPGLYATKAGFFRDVEYVPLGAGPTPIKLWGSPSDITPGAGVSWQDDALRLDEGGSVNGGPLSRDGILRARVRMNPDARALLLSLRWQQSKHSHYLRIDNGTFSLARGGDPGARILKSWPFPRAYGPDEWLPVEIRAQDTHITVTIEGTVMASLEDDQPIEAGRAQLYAEANGYFRDVEYVPLDAPTAK